MRFFASGFFHKSVFHRPLIIPLGVFQIFSKIRGDIRGDIRSSRSTTGVNDTDGKWKKSSIRNLFIIYFFWTPLGSRVSI
jgi:hypothetical protein